MREKLLNGKIFLFILCVVFAAGIVLGAALGALGAGRRGNSERNDLRYLLEQVNGDLRTTIESQREAADRAARLQAELQGITEYARKLEEGAGRLESRTGDIETRAGNLSQQLDGIIDQSGELAEGINRASGSLEESRILLDELGIVLRGLQGNNGKQN